MAIDLIKEIPLYPIFQIKRAFRKKFFSIDYPDNHPKLEVYEDYDKVKKVLKKHHLISGWLFSYNYEGEDGNMVRGEYKGEHIIDEIKNNNLTEDILENTDYSISGVKDVAYELRDDEYEMYQFHVRLFNKEDYVGLVPHHELYGLSYPSDHIDQINYNYVIGIATAVNIMEKEDIDYKYKSGREK